MLRNIEAERARLGMTKAELAEDLDVSLKTYYNWINENTDVPSSKLIEMSKKFKTTTDYLLESSVGVGNKAG